MPFPRPPICRRRIRVALTLAAALLPGLARASAAPLPASCIGVAGQLLIAAGMLGVTTVVHAWITVVQLELFHHQQLAAWCRRNSLLRLLLLVAMVLLIALALLVEILLWALVYWRLGLFADLNASAYFSGSTFTTVGFSDLALPVCWRVLGVSQALNGVLMAGWSTALLVALVQLAMKLHLAEQQSAKSPK